jgi:hypothetical protein
MADRAFGRRARRRLGMFGMSERREKGEEREGTSGCAHLWRKGPDLAEIRQAAAGFGTTPWWQLCTGGEAVRASVGVSDRRLLILCLRVWLGWCAKKTQGSILVRAECPYVQFRLLMFLHWFAVGVTNGRERKRAPNSLVAKCRASARVSESLVPPSGVLPFPLISQGQGSNT